MGKTLKKLHKRFIYNKVQETVFNIHHRIKKKKPQNAISYSERTNLKNHRLVRLWKTGNLYYPEKCLRLKYVSTL